jgi:hypothetical protein
LGSQNFSKFRNMLFCKCDYCLENIAFLAFNPLPACLDMPQAQPVTHSTGRYVWQMFPGLPTCTSRLSRKYDLEIMRKLRLLLIL